MRINQLVASALSAAAVLVAAPKADAFFFGPCGPPHVVSETHHYQDIVRPSQQYTVREGDTLSGIASRLMGDGEQYVALAQENHLLNPDHIYPGQTISVPEQLVSHTLIDVDYVLDWCPHLNNRGEPVIERHTHTIRLDENVSRILEQH